MSKEKYSHFERFRVRKSVVGESVTKQEIAKFWRQKLIEEEDHLLDAIKAAARLRARNLSEDDNKLFEESLKDDDETDENNTTTPINSTKYGKCDEMHLGIKDRWTNSNYAYLNQPTIESVHPPHRQSNSYCYIAKKILF